MSSFLTIFVLALIALGLIVLVWWLMIASEGVYLGRRVVIWLYDVYAGRYDEIKQYDSEYDHVYLAKPILDAVSPVRTPLVLDVATGTGRLPLALLRHRRFQGRIVGLDLSRRMLGYAAAKLDAEPRVSLIRSPAEHLPFPDDTFDVVSCLEALEFMDTEATLRELIRVLRPGGLLLITNRINTRLLPGKTHPNEQVVSLLETLGMERIAVNIWQVDYNRIWSHKHGASQPTLARPLAEILRCPHCSAALLVEGDGGWTCPNCHFHAPVLPDGVVDLAHTP